MCCSSDTVFGCCNSILGNQCPCNVLISMQFLISCVLDIQFQHVCSPTCVKVMILVIIVKILHLTLGKPVDTKTDEFPENFRKGGGGFFRSKKFQCNFFCFRKGNFGHEFPEKNRNIFSQKRGGWGEVKGCSEIF